MNHPRLYTTCLLLLAALTLCAQQKVTVSKTRASKPDEINYTFTAKNDHHYSVTVFLELQNARYRLASDKVPAATKLTGFSSRKLVTLFGATNDPGYKYRWIQGCLLTKPRAVDYLLPLAPDRQTTVHPLRNLNASYFGKDAPDDWAAYAFTADAGTEIRAARRGTVIEVIDHRAVSGAEGLNYASEVNAVKVEHEDCTIARYRLLAKGSATVTEGEDIEAGDVLGTVAEGANYAIGSHLQFIVYYAKITEQTLANYRSPSTTPITYGYVPASFLSAEGTSLPTDEAVLTVTHPEEAIFQEMSKREVKKWRKRQ